MAFADISNPILVAWARTQLDGDPEQPGSILPLIKMTDAEKVVSITAYLNGEVAGNNAELAGLDAAKIAQQTALNDENTALNAALAAL